ncbi:hypothetical protein DACRYDRAFT_98779 [Dacryopinax primogenitus]|uniref:Transcription initiation factor IIF subunit beta n=1 Tax=Dacryopinax primogenitus (strain DJM 731) TaxID=1858805 RepID=M5GE54_DACPD|nr:uncharacterized protein DACRYDRAFT_98779 [Dacryopinax primogenitus]EJU05092.1 hypothetical protein DACRYDRAFT_98779 [Dacryopinax primogenitus]
MDMETDAGPSTLDMDSLDPKREDDLLDYEGAESDDSFEPDEEMDAAEGEEKVWMVKLPKFLMEKWTAIEQEDVVLGTLRVYHAPDPNGNQRLVLRLPEMTDPAVYDITTLPKQYSLKMQRKTVENEFVMASKMKERERNIISTKLEGKIVHDCHAFPIMDASYTSLVASRHREANAPKRQTKVLEDEGGALHRINMLAGGAGENLGTGFGNFVSTEKKAAVASSAFERAARMPRNELMDLLFPLFRSNDNWSIRDLRNRTRQPEAYLREVLQEIGFLHRTGTFANMWSLLPAYKGRAAASTGEVPEIKAEGEGDMEMLEEDDEDDFDMEEVL